MVSSPAPEPSSGVPSARRRTRRGVGRVPRRAAAGRRSFASSLRRLEELAQSGAQVSVHVIELDSGCVVLSGDDHVPLPIAGLGIVPVLVETAAGFASRALNPLRIVDRPDDHVACLASAMASCTSRSRAAGVFIARAR